MAKKVLVTEDSPIVLNVHSTLLKSAGYDVTQAEDNSIALEKAKAGDFDLMVVDINTPKMDGYTFCKRDPVSDQIQRYSHYGCDD